MSKVRKIETRRKKMVLSKNDLILSEDIQVIPVDFYLALQGQLAVDPGIKCRI